VNVTLSAYISIYQCNFVRKPCFRLQKAFAARRHVGVRKGVGKGIRKRCSQKYFDRKVSGGAKRNSNNDDKHGHGQEKRKPATLS
jgi:hypothetical protein